MNDDIRAAVRDLKRERIILAAVELFHMHGFGRTTLDHLAKRMGVSKPFIYVHFRSKGELLAEICGQGIGAALAAIDHALAEAGSNRDKLAAFANDFMLAALDNRKHIVIYMREEKNLTKEDREAIAGDRRMFDRKLRTLLDEGVHSGEFDILETPIAALAIGGIASWSSVWFRPDGRLSAPEIALRMVSLVLGMTTGAGPGARRELHRRQA